ncbi:MAG: hypothetical protein P8X57_07560 [Cyclobacteriaceae bacterium]
MHISVFSIVLIFCSIPSIAQISNFNDDRGIPLTTKQYKDIQGSPYLESGDWMIGSLTDSDNKVIENIQLRFNAFDNELEVFKNGTAIVVYKNDIVSFDLLMIDSDGKSRKMLFKTGYELGNDVEKDDYVRIIYEGKHHSLIQLFSKDKIKVTPAAYGEAEYERFVDTSEYYLIAGNDYEEIKLNKRNFLKVFSNEKDAIKDYLSERSVDFNNPEDMKNLMIFIDELYLKGS